jgi:hypothetical protein
MELDLAAGLDGFPGLVGAAPTHWSISSGLFD